MEAAAGGLRDWVLVFAVDGARHALRVSGIEKVELAVEPTPLPDAPPDIIGAIDWRGRILPVLSMRRRLHAPDRPPATGDRLVIVSYPRRRLALLVDEIVEVRPLEPGDFAAAATISEGLGCVAGAGHDGEGIILIHDPEAFLTAGDEARLEDS